MWAPLLAYAAAVSHSSSLDNQPLHDPRFVLSCIYAALVFALALLPYSSTVWRNKSWRFGMTGLVGRTYLDWSKQIVLVTGG